jgi:uncharacterized membrane protein YbhN (UPF0104 family)
MTDTAADPKPRRRRRLFRAALALGVLATLLYVGRRYTDELGRLAAVSPWAVLGVVALYLPARWLSAEVMRRALASLGHALAAGEVLLLTFANSYVNLVVPRAGLGMPAAYLKLRRGVPVADVSAVQLVGMTLLQATCIGLIGLACLALLPTPPAPGAVPVDGWIYGVFAATAAGTLALLLCPVRVAAHRQGKLASFVRRVLESWRRLARDARGVATILVIQAAVLLLRGARVQLCFYAIGQPVGYLPALAASLLADVASLVGITPSGLGFRETAIVLASGVLGTSRDLGLAAAVLDRAVTSGVVIVVGQVAMWRLIGRPGGTGAAPADPTATE